MKLRTEAVWGRGQELVFKLCQSQSFACKQSTAHHFSNEAWNNYIHTGFSETDLSITSKINGTCRVKSTKARPLKSEALSTRKTFWVSREHMQEFTFHIHSILSVSCLICSKMHFKRLLVMQQLHSQND